VAISADADRIVFYLTNDYRENTNPPVHFSDFKDDSHFSFCLWVKVADPTVGDVLLEIDGPEGSKFIIQHGGGPWYLHVRKENVAIYAQATLLPVTVDRYTCFCVTKDGPNLIIYAGTEGDGDWSDTHLILTEVANIPAGFEFDFHHIAFVVRNQWAICNFKYWNYTLNASEFKEQVHYWNWEPRQGIGIPGESKYPIWASPLRTPGDLCSVANPSTGPNWAAQHAYFLITPPDTPVKFVSDPQFLRKWAECPTWLYELKIRGAIQVIGPNAFDPYQIFPINKAVGNTAPITTEILGDTYVEFQDRGSIPLTPVNAIGITYYGYPSSLGPGPRQVSTWGAFKDENGVDVLDTSDPKFQFEVDTGVDIPPPFVDFDKIYLWKYGAMFRWAPDPSVEPVIGTLQYIFMYVVYVGLPSAVPTLPVEDLTGLFAINKGGKSVDRYNRGVEVKIPNPTIRTAYIGE
jgi:hypothetical protein